MNKYSFREVKKLQGRIKQEIEAYEKLEDKTPINTTIIPKLFESLYKLDEPAWEEMIIKYKHIVLSN